MALRSASTTSASHAINSQKCSETNQQPPALHQLGIRTKRRRTKEDARAYAVKLTDQGRRVLRTIEPLAKKVDEHVLAGLPAKDRQNFISTLQSIIATLQPRQ